MIKDYENKHKGETCIVIGNGPSLKDCPRELLEAYPTFGANKIYLLEGFTPTYYTVIDQHMIHDCAKRLFKGDFKPEGMFIRRPYPIPGSEQILCEVGSGFSTDIEDRVIMGGTVTFANLQIAFYMGFETALLVGVDHHYPQMKDKRPGFVFQAKGEDENHFHPEYFAEGQMYAAPELEGTEFHYGVAKQVYEKHGRKIINITPDSKLDVFERGTYKEWHTP